MCIRDRYEDAIDEENNRFYRRWKLDPEITADLESWDYTTVLHRSLVDLTHMQGFFIKFVRNRAPRVGNPGRLVRLEHIPSNSAADPLWCPSGIVYSLNFRCFHPPPFSSNGRP